LKPTGIVAFTQDGFMPTLDGLLLTRDLMFTSKVTSTAAALGWKVEVVGTVELFNQRAAESKPRAVFLDLSLSDLNPARVVMPLVGEPRPVVIAFGSHVDEVRLQAAREAGCDEVMPRSKFSSTLPELLQRLFAVAES
jgi:CheY-like chemotaxis protein